MKGLIYQLKKLVSDVITICSSRGGLKALLHDPLYSNAIYLMLVSIANALFGFVFWIIAARFYSTGDVGLATAALSAASLLSGLSSIGFGYGMIRFLKSSTNPKTLINSSFTTVGVISVIAAIIFILGLGLWSPKLVFIRESAIYFAAFVLIIPAVTIAGLTDTIFIAGRRAGYVFARNLIFNVVRLAFLVGFATFLHSFGIFASWGMSIAVSLLVGILLFLPRFHSGYRPSLGFDRKLLTGILHFSFMNYLSDQLAAISGYLMPIVVLNVLGAESNAYYYIACSVGGMIGMIPSAISTSLFAEGSHKEEGLDHNVLRSLKMSFLLLIPAVILVLALADKLLLLFGGLYSENGTNLLRLIAVTSIPGAVNGVYFSIKRVQKKTKVIVGLSAFIGVSTLVLSYVLLPYAGIAGVGIAGLATQSCITLVVVADWLRKRRRG